MTEINVDTALLRDDARKWDAISDEFKKAVAILQEDVGVGIWSVDSITAEKTNWQSAQVTLTSKVINFGYRGRDVLPELGDVLRKMADLYDATEDDASVTFDRAYSELEQA